MNTESLIKAIAKDSNAALKVKADVYDIIDTLRKKNRTKEQVLNIFRQMTFTDSRIMTNWSIIEHFINKYYEEKA